MDLSIDKNMIDKDEYPADRRIESRCVHILADLWHSPKAADTIGCSTTGSSEACMLGGLALKWKWREKRQAAGQADRQAEPGLRAGAGLLAQIRPLFRRRVARDPAGARRARHDGRRGAEACRREHDRRDATFGVTFTCHYEPVAEVAAALDVLAERKGLDIPMHVDAAPAASPRLSFEPDLIWDFRLPRVRRSMRRGTNTGWRRSAWAGWCGGTRTCRTN